MQVQPINNMQSFGALKITPEAKALIEREKGGKYKIKKYTKELENSRWDLNVTALKCQGFSDNIFSYFGNNRECCVIPSHYKDEFVMVYSHDRYGDNEDDITDCLKFSSSERAKEVYETLKNHFHGSKTPLQHLDWDVYAMKAFTEAELVPQTKSPWAHFLRRENESKHVERFSALIEDKPEKPSFLQRLNAAWNAFLGK
ncbi:MAG: hypothetical protein NC408_00495 [Candidatus Gastranaerophilales bacterium]|nr:hypothetical protein [Candidatus Gastranaerophilales bacterium]MCM1073522.1 hypothetical protein [Bacteroides sp.]